MATGTLSEIAEYLVSGYSLETGDTPHSFNLGSSGTLSKNGTLQYSVGENRYATGDPANNPDNKPVPITNTGQEDLIRDVFKYLSNITGITFTESFDKADNAEISFGDNPSNAKAAASWRGTYGWDVVGESIFLDWALINLDTNWSGGDVSPNGYTFQTILHEVLHTLGLGHSGPYNNTATYPDDLEFDNDSWQNSIMSYISQTKNTSITATRANPQTLMAADIIAFDTLYSRFGYGSSQAFLGDTIYGFGTNLDVNDAPVMANLATYGNKNAYCIIDGGGIDTLDCSGWAKNQIINLVPTEAGALAPSVSSIGGLTGNLTLAYGTIIENATGGSLGDTIYGNYVDNRIYGGGGRDIIDSYGGNDKIYGGSGADLLKGGNGNDLATGGEQDDTIYGSFGHDTIYGSAQNDKLFGGAGNDRVYGGEDNDRLYLDAGNDTLDGGTGSDWIYAQFNIAVTVNLALTTAQDAGYGNDLITNIENVSGSGRADHIEGSAADNTFKGNNGNDVLYGAGGNDGLYGGGNDDTLYGGEGDDSFYGEGGNDVIYLDAGNDLIYGGDGIDALYVTGTKGASVKLASSTAQNTGYGIDAIGNIENIYGGTGGDTFYGSSGDNTIFGNDGNDTLSGGEGKDYIDGGTGDEPIYGDDGNDLIYGGTGNDYLSGGNDNDSLYGGSYDDQLLGGDGTDRLYGGTGNDNLYGGAGLDALEGGEGKDVLTGGDGADSFRFLTKAESSALEKTCDVIMDFERGVDKIDLKYMDASDLLFGNNEFQWNGTTAFATSSVGEIYFKQFDNLGLTNDYTMVYIDTDNDTDVEMSIKLMGLYQLAASDFNL